MCYNVTVVARVVGNENKVGKKKPNCLLYDGDGLSLGCQLANNGTETSFQYKSLSLAYTGPQLPLKT